MTTKLTARELWNLLPHGLHTRVLYQDQSKQDQDRIDQWFVYFDARIAAEKDLKIARLERFEVAFNEWIDKTEWVQEKKDWEFRALGLHRADVMRKEIFRLESELDKAAAEIAQLKARIAELERPATPIPPKPGKTAGEKLCDVLLAHGANGTGWKSRHEENKRALQAAAIELGLTDDPEPKSDGELLRKIWENAREGSGMWGEIAAEFRRLLAERDGGAT